MSVKMSMTESLKAETEKLSSLIVFCTLFQSLAAVCVCVCVCVIISIINNNDNIIIIL